jgi:hypothetical protein
VRRHRRLRALARRGRDGVRAIRSVGRGPRRSGYVARAYPETFRVQPAPAPIAGEWPATPEVDRPFESQVVGEPGPIRRYDVALFEALNAEYASHPVAPVAPRYDGASIAERSRGRIELVHDHLDLRGRTVLEIGCGAGFEEWYLAAMLGCDAWGIDIAPRRSWPSLVGDRVHLIAGDVADPGALPAGTFDRVMRRSSSSSAC